MPRKKLTPEETRAAGAELHKAMVRWAAQSPEERYKEEAAARARNERARVRRVAKHQPEATDVQSNGKYVTVAFTRANGERVIGAYKLVGWGFAPFSERWTLAERRALRAAEDAARETLPSGPAGTPRS